MSASYSLCSSRFTFLVANRLDLETRTLLAQAADCHDAGLTPPVDTPTEAEAISKYSHVFRRSEGLYLSAPSADSMEQDFLDACEGRDLDLIVVSDGEAILGIGDQASLEENGMRDPLQVLASSCDMPSLL